MDRREKVRPTVGGLDPHQDEGHTTQDELDRLPLILRQAILTHDGGGRFGLFAGGNVAGEADDLVIHGRSMGLRRTEEALPRRAGMVG